MQKNIVFILYIVPFFSLMAQSTLKLDYAFYDITGNNISLSYSKISKKKHHLSFGLKYHIDDPLQYVGVIFGRQLQAQKFIENIGLTAEYRRMIKVNKAISFYPFYHFQYTRKSPVVPDRVFELSTGRYFDTILTFEPINYWDNAIGVGFEFNLSQNLRYHINGGVGITFLFLYDNSFFGSGKIDYEFIKMFNTGFAYVLPSKKKKIGKSSAKKG
jgi:hypothetical protein